MSAGGMDGAGGAWEAVIGLEMHARLLTRSKIFSAAENGFCAAPNTRICEIDLGMPGVLPALNRGAVEQAIVFGLAVGGEIARQCEFARKNYFYPDLPKGYQISQYDRPIVSGGRIAFEDGGGMRSIDLTRAHLEEDAGKLTHDIGGGFTGADYNRAGCPLLEIVTEPQIDSPARAAAAARATRGLLRWLGVCDGEMQEGSFRVDANVSLRRVGAAALGVKCEIKNLNSFRFLVAALEFEIERQRAALSRGGIVRQQTRLFDESDGTTRAMRDKEDAEDYRYFPDPDLPPLRIDGEWIGRLRSKMPPSPDDARARLSARGLPDAAADLLTARRGLFDYFEEAAAAGGDARRCANWICGDLAALSKRDGIAVEDSRIAPRGLAELSALVDGGAASGAAAKAALAAMWKSGESAREAASRSGSDRSLDEDALESLASRVVAANPKQAAQFAAGKSKAMGWFVGQAMKQSGGKADPKRLSETFARLLAPAE